MKTRGIILAGGSGTRLYPITAPTSKQLLAVYDKPMIYYPLSTLMLAGIREILVISTPQDLPSMMKLLGDGSSYGVTISYAEQSAPRGLVEAFLIAEDFLDGADQCMLALGDNLVYGSGLSGTLSNGIQNNQGATVFSYKVMEPQNYGVVEFHKDGSVLSIEEKPENPKSNFAAIGLYIFDNRVCELSKQVVPSKRNELEISDLNSLYLKDQSLRN
ncbi:MAG: sugar phosphate nucleotidyltransferase, partial [Hyphomicrobiales bacterium]